jgi:hypothetical protein
MKVHLNIAIALLARRAVPKAITAFAMATFLAVFALSSCGQDGGASSRGAAAEPSGAQGSQPSGGASTIASTETGATSSGQETASTETSSAAAGADASSTLATGGSAAETATSGAATTGGSSTGGSSTGGSSTGGSSTGSATADPKSIAVTPPTLSVASGLYANAVQVSIASSPAEAKIRYTTDGSAPSATKGKEYSGPVVIEKTATLQAIAYIPGGKSSQVAARVYTIGEVCVAAGGKGDGRSDAPFGSIAAALQAAQRLGVRQVKVGAGVYVESLSVTGDVDLSGGWNASFSKRSGQAELRAPADLDSSQNSPSGAAVFSGRSVGADTKVVGFKFVGSDLGYAAGVVVKEGAAPSLSACHFVGGSGSYSYGLKVASDSAPRVSYSTIEGGSGGTSYGVSVDSARISLIANAIQAGSGTVASYGATFTNSRASIASCAIHGGKAGTTYGIAFYQCSEASVIGSTVLGGGGKTSYGIFIAYTAPTIMGNILGQAAFGVYENYGDSSPKRLEGNCFFSCAEALYSDSEAKSRVSYTAIDANGNLLAGSQTLQTPAGKSNVAAVPDLGGGPWYKTLATSPDAVLSGGVALPGVEYDIAGEKRTAPYSIGAWQVSK